MKKSLTIIITCFLILVIGITYLLCILKENSINKKFEYSKYKKYIEKEIKGVELITLMNKISDNNEKNFIQRDEKGRFIENEKNSIKLDVKFIDFKDVIIMEAVLKNGENEFLKHYSNSSFKCKSVEFHEKSKKIRYFLFEQI
ncbi:MAG: hypothetical protein Q4G05_00960 [Clostridia bacterium]|nr:hypothetical protein [Clostridia bacterium]